ncbi:MAG: hypothetical protein ACK493_13560 [Planctomycetota bacterium]|jgi:hypothetical protein|nr:hypothetical protein [Blastopirellula sp.]
MLPQLIRQVSRTLILLLLPVFPAAAQETRPAKLGFTNGSAIQVEVLTAELNWRDLVPGAAAEFRQIPVSEIELLLTAPQARTRLVNTIKELVEQLGDPDYRRREAAETELKQLPSDQVAALLTTATNNPSAEVAVRARRILSGRTPKPVNPDQFDWIKLTNGQILRGDAGEFQLSVRFRGQTLNFTRDQVNALSFVATTPPATAANATTSQLVAWDAAPQGLLELDFDRDFVGQDRENATNVNEQYTFQGVRFSSEIPGNIGIRTIPLESEKFGVGVRGVCVFDRRNPETVSIFRGVTRMEFCQPGLPGLASGIRQLGLVASTIDFPRDIILQAFNSDGQLLAQVEANEPKFAYFGLQAPEPIALVRVLSNPYLLQVQRKVDETYLIDGLKISTPERITPAHAGEQMLTTLRSGDLIVGGSLNFGADGSCKFSHPDLGLSLDLNSAEIESMVFAKSAPAEPDPKSNRWFALLGDRSVIEVQVGDEFTVNRLDNQPMDAARIVALWSHRDFLRYPLGDDLGSGKRTLVFPTCRIVCDQLKLSATGYSWAEGNPQTLLQPVRLPQTSRGEVPDENPAPQFNRLDWVDPKEAQVPSIWFAPPPASNPKLGFVSLRNGEQLSFGPGAEFQLQSISPDAVVLKSSSGLEVGLIWREIWRLKF